MNSEKSGSIPAKSMPVRDLALTLASIMVIVAGLRAATAIVVPFLLALFITVISTPFMIALKRLGLPNSIAVIAVLVVILVIGFGVVAFVGTSIQDFSQNTRQYERQLRDRADTFLTELDEATGGRVPVESIMEEFNATSAVSFFTRMLTGLGSTFGNAFLVALTVLFMLLEASGFPKKVNAIVGDRVENYDRLEQMVDDVRHYMFLKTIISLATGALVAAGLAFLGMPYALMWGLLAFFFNYVPNIGSFIAGVPAVVLAVLEGDSFHLPIYVAGVYLVVNVILGNLVEPRVMGKGLGLSTLVVFLSLVLWGWILGPVGMLLSVPLTMAIKIALDSSPDTRWMAILLGPDPGSRADLTPSSLEKGGTE